MTDEEFATEQNKILAEVPQEFRGALSYFAYDKWHAYGNHEILSELGEIVEALKKPIEAFEKRLTSG